jgi:signal transduction histidine kinase
VQVTLLHHGGWLRLRIQDDGRGPGPHARTSGHGLRNMRQRAAEAGGETTSAVVPGGGFAVEVRLPVAM